MKVGHTTIQIFWVVSAPWAHISWGHCMYNVHVHIFQIFLVTMLHQTLNFVMRSFTLFYR